MTGLLISLHNYGQLDVPLIFQIISELLMQFNSVFLSLNNYILPLVIVNGEVISDTRINFELIKMLQTS